VLLGVLFGTSAWMASSRFVSLPHDPDHVEYLFLSASWIKEQRPLWSRASPDYLPSLADAQARACSSSPIAGAHCASRQTRPRAAERARVIEAGARTIVRSSVFHDRRRA